MLTEQQRKQIEYAAGHLISARQSQESAMPDAHSGDSEDLAWEIFEELFATRRDVRRDFNGPMMQNSRGEWVPAIPMPTFGKWGRPQCNHRSSVTGECGKKFSTPAEYEAHYALVHIVRGE